MLKLWIFRMSPIYISPIVQCIFLINKFFRVVLPIENLHYNYLEQCLTYRFFALFSASTILFSAMIKISGRERLHTTRSAQFQSSKHRTGKRVACKIGCNLAVSEKKRIGAKQPLTPGVACKPFPSANFCGLELRRRGLYLAHVYTASLGHYRRSMIVISTIPRGRFSPSSVDVIIRRAIR